MANRPPSLHGTRRLTGLLRVHAEGLLGLALAASKAGTLDELLRRRPGLSEALAWRLLPALHAVAGDALAGEASPSLAWQLWMRATLARLRPDDGCGLQDIDPRCWLERTAWRPLLALACHYAIIPVADLASAYRARADDSPAERLCGLWGVGPSTFYRYVDKGKRLFAAMLFEPPLQGERALARDLLLLHEVHVHLRIAAAPARIAWHARQAQHAMQVSNDSRAALWHMLRAGDSAGFIHCLKRFSVELASHADTDALLQQIDQPGLDWRLRFELRLAQAALWRARGDEAAERQACEVALQLASAANDKLALGIAYGALGKLDESRDADRAFACYQDSVEFLRQAGLHDEPARADADVLVEYVNTLVKLAWLYVLRNDPRSKTVLDRAESLREHIVPANGVVASLEQTWGEYWRRSGELQRALEHKHRALHLYERLGDRQAILKTYGNLSLLYGDAKDFARAIDYAQRVLDMAQRLRVEPETLAATCLHLGAVYFWQGKYDLAIEYYQQALELSQRASLAVLVGRAHYNLAEAYYKRFQALDRADDERLGDQHSAAALAAWPDDGDAAPAEATRKLKAEILGPREGQFYDRLLPGEFAAHYGEMAEVQRQRAALALPLAAPQQVEAHLAIARAYLEICVKEREAAVALIDKHGLGEHFAPALRQLRQTFARERSREQRLAALWQDTAADLLRPERGSEVLQYVLHEGSVNKSGYARLCGVGLATASKQLGQLAERGLLVQTGKGPSTRYRLPR